MYHRLSAAIIILVILVSLPSARPFKSPVIDGTITGDGTDWDPDDLSVDDPVGLPPENIWGPNEIDDLWITYDAENLYIGVRYLVNDNSMIVLVDAGTGVGASDLNQIGWYNRNFVFPDTLLAEYIIANWNGGALGVRRITSNTSNEDITTECETASGSKGNFIYEAEVKIPWNSIYQLGPGLVQQNAIVRVVALIAGGDNWNGPDSAPDNPGMDGNGGPTMIVNMFPLRVDWDGDGLPDSFEGAIEGSVTYDDPSDDETVAAISVYDQGSGGLIEVAHTAPGGGDYFIGKLPPATLRVEASAPGYARQSVSDLVITGADTLRDVDFLLTRAGKITGEVIFRDGPGNTATVAAYDSATGEIAGEGALTIPPEGGSYELLVPDGAYNVIAESDGYVPDTVTAVITDSDSVGADTLDMYAVRASEIVLIDEDGDELSSVSTTVSFPGDPGIYFYASATIVARDDAGRLDLFDLDGHLAHVNLEATKLNNVTPPRGDVIFYTPDTVVTTSIGLDEGPGSFLMTGDEIEVLRIHTITASGGVSGRFKLGIRSAEPEFLDITALSDTIVADGSDEVTIEGRLLDINRNPVSIQGIGACFSFAPSSTGQGTFKIPSVPTNADGEVEATFTATGAGNLHVTASVTYQNRDLTILGDETSDYVEVTAVAGDPAAIRLSTEMEVIGFGETMDVTAQLVDANGNPVRKSGYSVTFSSSPVQAGSVFPGTAAMDDQGQAVTEFTAGTERSVVEVSALSTPTLPIDGITFLVDRILSFSDPKAPEPDQAHNSLAPMDLTNVSIGNTADCIEIKVKFSSNFDGVHIGLILETGEDSDGGSSDPFAFPISYNHADRPEYVLIYKYASNDYADFRKWGATGWEWWDNDGGEYRTEGQGWVDGVDIHDDWIARDTAFVDYVIPFDVFESSIPERIRMQVYLMQEIDEEKRSAFDSAPHDSTLDLDFDPSDPEAPWEITTAPVALNHYSPVYEMNLIFPEPPAITDAAAEPPSVNAGETVTFTAAVTDAGDGIGNVLIDLSPIGGPRFQSMRDDGTNGDATADDGVFSHRYLVDPGVSGGSYEFTVMARDAENISSSDTTVALDVEGISTAIRSFTDELDDDHGPNLFGREGLYYLYPTNSVFLQRAFDIEEVTIFETSKIVSGEIIPSLAFKVKIGNFPNPDDEGTADWNPLYADINIHKIDIYIDAFKGGATEGLPNRQNDFVGWDAWDYAIVMDGWYKGVIASNNQNTPQAWSTTACKSDRDILLLSDYEQNTMTAVVSNEALGNPTAEDIQNWDITVLMTGHDGHSDDNNFGDTRWVNASVSEWQFGGGGDRDRDSNIIDFVASPGLGKKSGRDQSTLLDYKSAEAVARLEKGETAIVMEATEFEDQGPPVIMIDEILDETVPVIALENAPIYYTATISDDDRVSKATFSWRADSSTSGEWTGELPMGYAGSDIWSIDLPLEEIEAVVPLADVDSTRNIEFIIEASDPSGNVTTTPLYTMEIPLPVTSYEVGGIDLTSDFEMRAPEGTFISIPSGAIPGDLADLRFRVRLSTNTLSGFRDPPAPARTIDVIRTVEIEAFEDTLMQGEPVPVDELKNGFDISLHYPQYSIGRIDENLLAAYEYNYYTRTWILLGGNVNPFGNLVTIHVTKPGTFGIFYNPSFKYSPGEVFSGLEFTPNPFSPNGDGLYEETNITFFLTQEATITIEIFNIDGDRVRILKERITFSAEDIPDKKPRRITGMTWDGRDNMGNVVPYGIYIARFTVTFQQAGGTRTIRKNAAVVVIK